MIEYGLIGERLGHSYSPPIHRVFGDYDYQLYPMSLEQLKETLEKRAFKGLNITIPYKKDVLPYCDEISDVVRKVGSANTLVMRNGRLYADNTDLAGFIFMLEKAGIELAGKKVVILGSGGTSLTAQAACRELGAGEYVVVSRSGPVDYTALYEKHTDARVIINSTPVGMYPKNMESPVDLNRFPLLEGVADVIYNPARTKLLLDAREKNIPCIDGLWMLVAQAWHAARQFTDRDIPVEKVDEAYREVRRDCLNLVLAGMPGCGKTTLGRALARRLSRKFVDLDEEIEKEYGHPSRIIQEQGEEKFRNIESKMAARFGKESGLVIATGGGAVLRRENVRALTQNGVIVWVKRPLEKLSTKGRPLSQGGLDGLRAMARKRFPLYEACASFSVENDGEVQRAADRILEGFHEAAGH